MNKMIEEIKQIHPKAVCMFKVGSFYHAYGRDAVVLSYIFDYKIKELGNSKECGFPINAVNRVIARLQNMSISYLLIDRRNNYDVDEKEDYKDKNTYDKVYDKAARFVSRMKRIDNINKYLIQNIDIDNITKTLIKIEEIMYEN